MNAVRRVTDEEGEPSSHDMRTEAMRVQSELLRVLHAEGEARTRRTDKAKPLIESAVPFVIGVLIGALGTYAGISGRLATLEAVQQQQTREMSETRSALNELLTLARTANLPPIKPR
jgi:hypothetical protein